MPYKDYGSRLKVAEAYLKGELETWREAYLWDVINVGDLTAAKYRIELGLTPNWADENGRFHWKKSNDYDVPIYVEIPHPPVSIHSGCKCEFCVYMRKKKKEKK